MFLHVCGCALGGKTYCTESGRDGKERQGGDKEATRPLVFYLLLINNYCWTMHVHVHQHDVEAAPPPTPDPPPPIPWLELHIKTT